MMIHDDPLEWGVAYFQTIPFGLMSWIAPNGDFDTET